MRQGTHSTLEGAIRSRYDRHEQTKRSKPLCYKRYNASLIGVAAVNIVLIAIFTLVFPLHPFYLGLPSSLPRQSFVSVLSVSTVNVVIGRVIKQYVRVSAQRVHSHRHTHLRPHSHPPLTPPPHRQLCPMGFVSNHHLAKTPPIPRWLHCNNNSCRVSCLTPWRSQAVAKRWSVTPKDSNEPCKRRLRNR